MHTIRSQFTHVGRTESTGNIHLQVQVVAHIKHSPNAARQSIEVAREIREAQFIILHQLIAMQVAMVITHATVQRPAVTQLLRGCGIEAEVKQAVVWNQVFLTLVARFLIHTTNTRREFPAVKLVGHVAQVVGQRVQLEV